MRRILDRAVAALPLWLAATYLVVAPNFDLIPFAEAYDEKRLLQIGLLLANAVWLLASPLGRRGWLDTWRCLPRQARALLASVVVVGAVSSDVAAFPRAGLLEVSHYVLLACLAISVASVTREDPARASRTLLTCIAAGIALYVAAFAANLLGVMLTTGSPPASKDAYRGFLHFRFVGQWQTWTLPLLVALPALIPDARRRWTLAIAVLAASWWALLFAAGTRGAIAGQIVATLLVAVVHGAWSREWLDRHLRAAWQGLALYLLVWVAIARDLTAFAQAFVHAASASSSGRLGLWKDAAAMVLERPLLGAGPQHFVDRPGVIAAHPHNAVIQWASEWGLPVSLAVSALIGWGLWRWLERRRAEPLDPMEAGGPVLAAALTASLAAAAVHAMVSGIVVMPLSQTLMAVVGGLALGIYHRAHPTALVYRPRAESLLATAVLTFSIAFVLCVLPEPMHSGLRYGDVTSMNAERFRPRFWQRGELAGRPPLDAARRHEVHAAGTARASAQ